jgi:hypothetical protein
MFKTILKNSQRSDARLKPKFPRIQRLLAKRKEPFPPRGQWFTTADDEGNVEINPNR